MFVMEILQEIIIHFSFDIIRTFCTFKNSFSGHTLSVEVQTSRRLKLIKTILEIWLLRATKVYNCFNCKGGNFTVTQL